MGACFRGMSYADSCVSAAHSCVSAEAGGVERSKLILSRFGWRVAFVSDYRIVAIVIRVTGHLVIRVAQMRRFVSIRPCDLG